jgi:hypothetical protein
LLASPPLQPATDAPNKPARRSRQTSATAGH